MKRIECMTQEQVYQHIVSEAGVKDMCFLFEILPTLKPGKLQKLIEKRPALWERYAGYKP